MSVATKTEEERRKVGTSEVADKRIVEPPPLTYLVPHESEFASLVLETTSRGQHKAMAPVAQLNPVT